MLKPVSFVLALGLASPGIAQQSPAAPRSTPTTSDGVAKHVTSKKRETKARHHHAPSNSSAASTPDTMSDRNAPAGTVPVGAPGTADPTIPGSPPQP